jgi:hypothetical protein
MLLTNCNLDMCDNDIYQRLDSKWGTYKIVKFSRGCGATTGSSIQISVLTYNKELPNEAGNAFISNGSIVDTTVKAAWLNDTAIVITYSKELTIFKNDSTVGGIKIYYNVQ